MRVLDLSTLWSGPLCAQLLQSLGACVVKAESLSRPDGARRGPTAFYDLLNHGKHSVALDFAGDGVSRLRELIDWADVVIESARPRGLQQLGISAEQCVAARNGLTWISITGYGREPPQGDWIAFGDDAGIAAGLSALLQQVSGLALICGDAVADPLTGLHAALAALASHQQGGGHLLSLSLRDVVEHCVGFSRPGGADLTRRWQDWTTEVRGLGLDGQSPVARTAAGRARALGADTETVMAWLRRPC
jgi:crotonobetainyl-CoA:carnitine CoA-transferase CaiB-like acyl-CoA transferase